MIEWKVAKIDKIEEYQKKKKPLVLFFMEEDMDAVDGSRQVHDAELAKMAKSGDAVFLLIEYNGDRTPSLNTGSPIPTSKLASPNPARDYNVSKYPTLLVCDYHGNEFGRFDKAPQAKDVKSKLDGLNDSIEAMEQKLRKNLDAAKASLEKNDLRNFFKTIFKNFGEGIIGLKAQEEGIKVYRELLDKTRDEIDTILEDRPKDGESRLKALSKNFRDTELRKEIDDALAIIKG
ncbi:MAG: hypothetical protein IT464_11310 [Planctomycetes bacterium]|nr:hypothetical protein [Planctomycetota bacterium]